MEKTKQPLSTFRLVAGIITIVLSVLVTFQSCAAGLSNALEENGESGGSAGAGSRAGAGETASKKEACSAGTETSRDDIECSMVKITKISL